MAESPARTHTTPAGLIEAGLIAPARRAELDAVARRYAVALPPALAELIDPNDPMDPIAIQFLPDARELEPAPFELADPIGDGLKSPVKGLVHRYRDRALIKLVSVCAVYCRFCFRREMVGPGGEGLDSHDLAAALDYVRAHPEIWEIIFTGGDPLALSPRRLAETVALVTQIPHVKVMRWHTRLPVAAPERVTEAMADALVSGHERAVYVALHANHPRELTPAARAALRRLQSKGIVVVSQSVLLKGVNDNVDTLEALMRAFVEARVKPYYLHHADFALGTAHLRTSLAQGQALMRELRRRVSGLAMPAYMLDIPGAHGKAPLGPGYLEVTGERSYRVTDPDGHLRDYVDPIGR